MDVNSVIEKIITTESLLDIVVFSQNLKNVYLDISINSYGKDLEYLIDTLNFCILLSRTLLDNEQLINTFGKKIIFCINTRTKIVIDSINNKINNIKQGVFLRQFNEPSIKITLS